MMAGEGSQSSGKAWNQPAVNEQQSGLKTDSELSNTVTVSSKIYQRAPPTPILPEKLAKARELYARVVYEQKKLDSQNEQDRQASQSTTPSLPRPKTVSPRINKDVSNMTSSFSLDKSIQPKARRRSVLSPYEKAKTHLIRYLEACSICRTRKVKCCLDHHDLSLLQDVAIPPIGSFPSNSSSSSTGYPSKKPEDSKLLGKNDSDSSVKKHDNYVDDSKLSNNNALSPSPHVRRDWLALNSIPAPDINIIRPLSVSTSLGRSSPLELPGYGRGKGLDSESQSIRLAGSTDGSSSTKIEGPKVNTELSKSGKAELRYLYNVVTDRIEMEKTRTDSSTSNFTDIKHQEMPKAHSIASNKLQESLIHPSTNPLKRNADNLGSEGNDHDTKKPKVSPQLIVKEDIRGIQTDMVNDSAELQNPFPGTVGKGDKSHARSPANSLFGSGAESRLDETSEYKSNSGFNEIEVGQFSLRPHLKESDSWKSAIAGERSDKESKKRMLENLLGSEGYTSAKRLRQSPRYPFVFKHDTKEYSVTMDSNQGREVITKYSPLLNDTSGSKDVPALISNPNQQLIAPRSPPEERHKCPYCDTEFNRYHNLKSHLLTHDQDKPFVCQTCNLRFRRLHDLKRHAKLHTGEKPHVCPKCNRSFARGDALARHSKGQGGCAGRRASASSFGGEDGDYDENLHSKKQPQNIENELMLNILKPSPEVIQATADSSKDASKDGNKDVFVALEVSRNSSKDISKVAGKDASKNVSKALEEAPSVTVMGEDPIRDAIGDTTATRSSIFRLEDWTPPRIYDKTKDKIFRALRRKVAQGYKRIEWTCGCGASLYADFKENNSDNIKHLTAALQNPDYPSNPNMTTSHEMHRIPGRPNSGLASGSGSSSVPLTSSVSQLTALKSSSAGSSNCISVFPEESYLEVCINTGEYTKILSEIDLRHIRCDGTLFKTLRKEYFQHRGFRSKFWLLKPSRVDFVRFSVQYPKLVGILSKPLALPPKSEVDLKNYYYCPCPLEGDPPIPQDIFLHSLSCNAPDAKKAWLPRFPRKLDSPILNFTGDVAYGWGIHISEGPNYFIFCVINVGLMIISGLAAFLWKYFMHDFSGAFGFAGWIVAVSNGILVAYIMKWQKE